MVSQKAILILALIIFLAVVVIVIVSFTGKQKADPLSAQCEFACQTGQQTGFCEVERTLSNGATATCDQLSSDSQYSSYNVQPCSAISCVVSAQEAAHLADQTCITGLGGTWETPVDGTCPQSGIKVVRQVNSSDQPQTAGQICCR